MIGLLIGYFLRHDNRPMPPGESLTVIVASGFVPLGYVRGSDPDVSANSLPLLGELEQLQTPIRDHATNCLFVASSALTFEDISWVAQAARKESVEVRVSANLPRMLPSRLCFQTVGQTIAISLRPVRLTGRQVMLKRGFDLVVASIGLVLAAPCSPRSPSPSALTSPGARCSSARSG
jgi:hypothetical protein